MNNKDARTLVLMVLVTAFVMFLVGGGVMRDHILLSPDEIGRETQWCERAGHEYACRQYSARFAGAKTYVSRSYGVCRCALRDGGIATYRSRWGFRRPTVNEE